jgi:hypothetical protein
VKCQNWPGEGCLPSRKLIEIQERSQSIGAEVIGQASRAPFLYPSALREAASTMPVSWPSAVCLPSGGLVEIQGRGQGPRCRGYRPEMPCPFLYYVRRTMQDLAQNGHADLTVKRLDF